jgi:ABC-type transporter Mla MlaB component
MTAHDTVILDASLQIKDVEQAHRRLLAALGGASSVSVDVSPIDVIDTAGLQLLLALQRGAASGGVPVEFHGESAALSQALSILGLRDALKLTPHA